jgi:hypothetical protein
VNSSQKSRISSQNRGDADPAASARGGATLAIVANGGIAAVRIRQVAALGGRGKSSTGEFPRVQGSGASPSILTCGWLEACLAWMRTDHRMAIWKSCKGNAMSKIVAFAAAGLSALLRAHWPSLGMTT